MVYANASERITELETKLSSLIAGELDTVRKALGTDDASLAAKRKAIEACGADQDVKANALLVLSEQQGATDTATKIVYAVASSDTAARYLRFHLKRPLGDLFSRGGSTLWKSPDACGRAFSKEMRESSREVRHEFCRRALNSYTLCEMETNGNLDADSVSETLAICLSPPDKKTVDEIKQYRRDHFKAWLDHVYDNAQQYNSFLKAYSMRTLDPSSADEGDENRRGRGDAWRLFGSIEAGSVDEIWTSGATASSEREDAPTEVQGGKQKGKEREKDSRNYLSDLLGGSADHPDDSPNGVGSTSARGKSWMSNMSTRLKAARDAFASPGHVPINDDQETLPSYDDACPEGLSGDTSKNTDKAKQSSEGEDIESRGYGGDAKRG